MKDYLISLIVPVYNKEKYLKKSIDSMVNQSYENLEIILVDDGSADNSGAICDTYGEKYNNVKVIHQKNQGPSEAWKNGFKVSKGEYIAFADSDDWIDHDMIEKMSKHLTGNNYEIVTCDHVLEYADGISQEVYQTLLPGEYNKNQIYENILPYIIGLEKRHISLSRCMKLISRNLIEENEKYCDSNILMGDDSTITLPCIIDAERIYNMDHEAMYHYLYVNDSVVHRYDPNMFQNNKNLYNNYIDTISQKFKDDSQGLNMMLSIADKEFIFLLLLVIKNEARGNRKNCQTTIKTICNDFQVKNLVKNTGITINEKSNVLLYMVLKNPSSFNIALLKLAMNIYYRKNKND